jgi:hypothetical protein
VALDRHLVRGDELFALRRRGSGEECRRRVGSWIARYRVRPRWIRDDDTVLRFRDGACEMAIFLPLFVVVRFDNGENAAEFVFETIDGFGS